MSGIRKFLVLSAGLSVLPVAASAGMIDFTSGVWAGANGNASATRSFDGLGVTVRAINGTGGANALSFTGFDGKVPGSVCGPVLACRYDGVGIVDDEISYGNGRKEDVERVVVEFSNAVTVTGIHFFDLFFGTGGDPAPGEMAQVQAFFAGGGSTGFGVQQADTGTGWEFWSGTLADVTRIEFFADSYRLASPEFSDFALAGIEVTGVPEPAGLALLGIGLAGLALRRRAAAARAES